MKHKTVEMGIEFGVVDAVAFRIGVDPSERRPWLKFGFLLKGESSLDGPAHVTVASPGNPDYVLEVGIDEHEYAVVAIPLNASQSPVTITLAFGTQTEAGEASVSMLVEADSYHNLEIDTDDHPFELYLREL